MPKEKDNLRDFSAVSDRILAANKPAAAAWEKVRPSLDVVLMLVRLRKSRGLTQADVAARVGWDKSFVSRLERPTDRMPDLTTISRYLEACDARAGLVIASTDTPAQMHVEDAVSLGGGEDSHQMFEILRDRDIAWDDSAAGAAG
jgi:transcriptional regulator with XRE-family HTH domain